jgi:hypothetical protein
MLWVLAAFFALGAIGNIFASESILADYERWGYPSWFHYITGLVELTVSLLLITRFRMWGALLGSLIMASAVATVLFHGEYPRAIPPLVTLALCLLAAFLFARAKNVP